MDLVTRAAMVLAPLLLLGSSIGDGATAGLLQVLAMVSFVAVVVGLVARIAEPAPRAAAALLLLGCLGCAGGLGYGFNLIAISHGFDLDLESGAAVILKVTGICFPLTFIGLGLALLRTRTSPVATAAAIAAAGLLFPVSRIGGITPLMILVDVLLLLGLAGIAVPARRPERHLVGARAAAHPLRAPA